MENVSIKKKSIIYGVVTVSNKGQIAIPVDLRNDMDLDQGDQFMVLKRKDNVGFTFIRLDKIDELVCKVQEDVNYFEKQPSK
jgi:AbrB family looped-hinge helix DNA binding protein